MTRSVVRTVAGWLGAAAALSALACGSARRSEPIRGPLQLGSAQEVRGERLFAQHCNSCHPQGEGGLAPGLNDKPLPGPAIHTQIRSGVGAMPGFSEEILSDREVGDIVAYMKALRRHDGEPSPRRDVAKGRGSKRRW